MHKDRSDGTDWSAIAIARKPIDARSIGARTLVGGRATWGSCQTTDGEPNQRELSATRDREALCAEASEKRGGVDGEPPRETSSAVGARLEPQASLPIHACAEVAVRNREESHIAMLVVFVVSLLRAAAVVVVAHARDRD